MKKSVSPALLPIVIAAIALAIGIYDCYRIKSLEAKVQNLQAANEAASNELAFHNSVLSKMQSAFSAPVETPAPAAAEVQNA